MSIFHGEVLPAPPTTQCHHHHQHNFPAVPPPAPAPPPTPAAAPPPPAMPTRGAGGTFPMNRTTHMNMNKDNSYMSACYFQQLSKPFQERNEIITSQEVDSQNNSSEEENFLFNQPKKRRY
ncbi:hypothetical protein F8M41_009737 [Gigaspora margarita]|uniref:Uncharacterized protein n=1 Tax=Gigaspora margarita TaxID=4874 RepID=A0A8H4A3S3_GIGMA|nr:hypothetical protein F8M41_009737 [Gigaspora margarita]